MANSVFMSLCLSLTFLYFIVTGIQYWTPDYLMNVLDVPHDQAVTYFSITSFTAPVGGVIIGGIMTSAYGGYNSKKAMKLQCYMSILSCSFGIVIPFLSNFKYVGICFWALLFFGGCFLPSVTGIMICSVSEFQKSQANSIANLSQNLFGNLPSPLLYGYISQVSGGPKSRWPMGFLLYTSMLTMILVNYGIIKKIRQE